MIDRKTIFEIHRLKHEGRSQRNISQELKLGRDTVEKYLENPEELYIDRRVLRPLKLEPYCKLIDQLLNKNPVLSAPVIFKHLKASGLDGEITILRNYLRNKRNPVFKECQKIHMCMIKTKLYRCMVGGIAYFDDLEEVQSEPIPTLNEWGIIIFMTIMMGIGVMVLRKKRMA